jgi:Hemerythrin HHE cation binding domain
VATTHDRDRAVALSRQLAQAHQRLREQLADTRTSPGKTLTAHCLAFCAALTAHHQGEDAGMFTDLLRERPDLADTVRKLVEDHEMISSILTRVAELSGRTADSAIELELDGLTAIMENHFRYEERALSAALDDGVADTGWSGTVFRFERSKSA